MEATAASIHGTLAFRSRCVVNAMSVRDDWASGSQTLLGDYVRTPGAALAQATAVSSWWSSTSSTVPAGHRA